MAKLNWEILKNCETGEYYPSVNDSNIQWDIEKQSFINQRGVPVELVYNLGKITDSQRDMFWKGFQLGMELKERDMKNVMENELVSAPVNSEKSQSQVLKEILNLAKEELKEEGDSVGYTMPDGKYHLFIYVDNTDEKLFVIEPNRLEDGGYEPFVEDTYLVEFGDYSELMVGCMWSMECFERDQIQNKENVTLKEAERTLEKASPTAVLEQDCNAFNDGNYSISLKEFVNAFGFDFEIVMSDEHGERKQREELIEEGELFEEDLGKPMLRIVDLAGANFGDIEGDRFRLDDELASHIIERMDVYVNDSVISEFEEALDNRGVDISSMSLKEMTEKALELSVGDGEVSYRLASAVVAPKLIDISDALEKGLEKSKEEKEIKESLDCRIDSAKEDANREGKSVFGKQVKMEGR